MAGAAQLPHTKQRGKGGAMRMSELAAQREEEARLMGWDDYLAWEASERELNEQALKEADEASSTQH